MDMVRIRYTGSLPIAATIGGVSAIRGEIVEVSTALAERICAAPHWERVEDVPDKSFDAMTVDELYEHLRKQGVDAPSKAKKAELVELAEASVTEEASNG